LALHVFQSTRIDDVGLATASTQQFKKVNTAFRLGTFKPGEQLIANMSTVTDLSLMASPRVICVNIAGQWQSITQQIAFFLVKHVKVFGQHLAELTTEDINTEIMQLFQQQTLSDMLMMVLIQDKTV
jgi:hypothetical protein